MLLAAGCTTDIPNGISALRQLTSLEYWSQVTCPSPQLSCLRALESLAVAWHGENEEIGVDNNWVEGIACLPSLKELGYNYFARVPSEFYALQLTSLNLGFNEVDDVDDVEQVCASASANYRSAENRKACKSVNSSWAGPD